jgi:hypothetical protein
VRRAFVLIRDLPHYRRDAFSVGLKAAGYAVEFDVPRMFHESDVLVIWNRYYEYDSHAVRAEKAGATVLIAENGYLGTEWRGERWYSLSRSHHNGAGDWQPGGAERWDGWNVELPALRTGGREYVVLPQRGIGPAGVAMPNGWECVAADWLRQKTSRPIRIRHHPGAGTGTPLEEDLAQARGVVTWGSGAALKALLLGIPSFHALPNWIGAPASRFIDGDLTPLPDNRLAMFRRLAWAMWTLDELRSGEPFRRLCAL